MAAIEGRIGKILILRRFRWILERWRWSDQQTLVAATPADVLLFRMRDGSIAKHLGLAAEVGAEASFVHAYSGHGVIESPLSAPWARRIVGRYAFPKGAN
jgi:hypothetical protein